MVIVVGTLLISLFWRSRRAEIGTIRRGLPVRDTVSPRARIVSPGRGIQRGHDGDLVHLRAHDRPGGARPALAHVAPPALAGLPEGEARIATETGFYRDQLR